jgi:peptide/nickel transport system substrate-binding protein
MNRRIFCLLFIVALVGGALPLFAGGQVERKEAATAAEGEPQYGGTLTAMLGAATADPGNPDIGVAEFWAPSRWLSPVLERPVRGDFEKYGPRGTGEYSFDLSAFIPDAYMTGNLLEKWEITPTKTTWYVRPGIYWAGNRPQVMKSRELVADDMVQNLIYFRDSPAGKAFKEMTTKIYTTGKYSLVIETPKFDVNLMYFVGYEDRALVVPPETRKAGASKWENFVGTGPFMLEEYVVGSHMSYVKNPNYWKTTTIKGKEYKLPFFDKLVYPIIPDPTVQTAALRTARIEYDQLVPAQYWQTLKETAPDLVYHEIVGNGGNVVTMKVTEPPLNDLRVRRALIMATDMDAFAKLAQVQGKAKDWYPVYFQDPKIHTPIDQLPPDVRELYTYSPEKAKQLLAQAGYPNGFKLGLLIESSPANQDEAELLADQWAKVGVSLQIDTRDMVTARDLRFSQKYKGGTLEGMDVGNPLGDGLVRRNQTGALFNFAGYSSPEFDALADKMLQEIDVAKRNEMIKQAAVLVLRDAVRVPLHVNVGRNYWWPWIKNYFGEYSAGDGEYISILSHAWIDQSLKKKMGK